MTTPKFKVGDKVRYNESYRSMGEEFDQLGEVLEVNVNVRGIEILLVDWENRPWDVPQIATSVHLVKAD